MEEMKQLGRYEIVRTLASGRSGTIFEGRDNKLGRPVVVRTAPRSEDFRRQAQAIAHLDHPHILTISDFGEEGESAYLVTEFVSGGRLEQALEGAPFPFRKSLGWIIDLLDALEYAHSQGLVHGDVSPANILIDASDRLKLTDFGLKSLQDACLSPEQAQGAAASPVSDVFAAGAVLYRMLTWKNPFAGPDESALLASILEEEPKPPSSLNKEIPVEIDRIIGKALAKKPEQRYARAAEFAEELKKFMAEDDLDRILDERAKLESSINEKFTKVITVMFTDLKGSTAIAENEGDLVSRMLIKQQNEILLPAIRDNQGTFVKSIGDGTLSYFEHALDALRAAVRIQHGMDELNMSRKFRTPVLMRIGMHTGRCMVESKDILGDVVNTASRFESSADPGMILISEDTYNALSDKSEIYCRFIKQVSLKGKAGLFNAYKAFWNPQEVELDKRGQEALPRQEAQVPVRSSGMKLVMAALVLIVVVLMMTMGLKFFGSSHSNAGRRSISDSVSPAGESPR